MFESIKGAMVKSAQQNTTSNIMRLKPSNTYTLRLVPFEKDPSKTFFHYYSHGWVSEMTGQYLSAISPQTWGERDPIAEARYRLSRTGSEEEKELIGMEFTNNSSIEADLYKMLEYKGKYTKCKEIAMKYW